MRTCVMLLAIVPMAWAATVALGQGLEGDPGWRKLIEHPVPEWFVDSKFGIFIHWGPYSVPGWSDGRSYSEWYATNMCRRDAYIEHHKQHYGVPPKFGYRDFVPLFTAEKFGRTAIWLSRTPPGSTKIGILSA